MCLRTAAVKVIIIRGAGDKAFAAGTDISLFKDFSPEKGVEYEKGAERYFSAVATMPCADNCCDRWRLHRRRCRYRRCLRYANCIA